MGFFILSSIIVVVILCVRWAAKSRRNSQEKTKANLEKVEKMMYSEIVDPIPSNVAVIYLIQQIAKEQPAVIEQLLSWTETLKYPLKGNVLKFLHIALK
jgi:hypothetical protein